MNKRLLSVLMFAVLVSGAASLLIYKLIVAKVSANSRPTATPVLMATRDLQIGALIREGDVKIGEWQGPAPSQVLTNPADVIGRGVIANIYSGEPIPETRLAPKGAGAGLAAIIPKGMRATAVRVNEVVGVAGFVVPGMRVDVLVSGTPPTGQQANLGTQTRTILQNIEVLSAGQNIQKDAEGKPVSVQVVNLLVTPEQAETLSLASNDMRIQLVLRNPLDTDDVKTTGTAMASIFGGRPVEPPPAAKPRPRVVAAPPPPPPPPPAPVATTTIKVVEVFTGAKKAESKFEKKSEVNP